MAQTLSQALGKTSEVANDSTRKVKQDGIRSFVSAAKNRTRYLSLVFAFNTLFGSITRDEMAHRAKQSGRYWEYGSAEHITHKNQASESVPDLFEEYAGSYDIERPFVCELPGGWLINAADPFVLTRDRKLVMETEKPLFGPREDGTVADTPFHKRTEYSERTERERLVQLCRGYAQTYRGVNDDAQFEAVFPLIRRDSSYAHWLVDQLPAVRGLRRYTEATGHEPTVVVESNPPDWIRETLSLVGVDDVVPFDMSVAKTDRLVVASRREIVPRNQPVYEPSREDISWLVSEMKSRVPATDTEYPDRIYISRENLPGRGRNVTNRQELNSVLEEFGIEVCTPETLSIAEQIRLYENADLIVGPHGAGLTNMIFSSDTSVIELLSTPYPMYQHLAHLVGHEYQFLRCGEITDHHAPITVDTTELRQVIADIDSRETESD